MKIGIYFELEYIFEYILDNHKDIIIYQEKGNLEPSMHILE